MMKLKMIMMRPSSFYSSSIIAAAPHVLPLQLIKPSSSRLLIKQSHIMASAGYPIVVEHMVLFRFKEQAAEEKVSASLTQLNALRSLDSVLYLTAGPLLLRHHSGSSSTASSSFTHILHSRHSSDSDLLRYRNHPSHLSLVQDSLLPICHDIMAIDWIDHRRPGGGVSPPPGSLVKLLLMKPRRSLDEDEKGGVLRAAASAISIGGGAAAAAEEEGEEEEGVWLSGGENFSPARGKGFSLASIVIFPPGLAQLGRVQGGVEEMMKGWVGELLETTIHAHYLLPPPSSPPSS